MSVRGFLVEQLERVSPRLMNWLRYSWHVGVRGWHGEARLYRAVAQALNQDGSGVAVDVGGNTGTVGRLLAKLYDRVHVVEPLPILAARLKAGLPRNCHVHAVGLAAQAGQMTIRIPVNKSGREMRALSTFSDENGLAAFESSGVARYDVPVSTLDIILDEIVGAKFVKIDVEGFELDVLRGAEHALSVIRPVFYIEICKHYNPRFEHTLDVMRSARYHAYKWENEQIVSAGSEDIQRQSTPGSPGGLKSVYDFLFVPEELEYIVDTINREFQR